MESKEGNKKELESRKSSIKGEGGSSDITINISIDMRLLESSLQQKIDAKVPFMSPNCCIFKTPRILFRHNAKAFLPNAFSIGPFHHGKKHLRATEKIKHEYMQGLVSRSGLPVSKFIEVIENIEKDARDCYEGPIVLRKKDFVEMLILDGCLIIELFRKYVDEKLRDVDDPLFTMSCLQQCLNHDLILLENQIPWKVLELLFDLTGPNTIPLDVLTIIFFNNFFSCTELSIELLMRTHFANHKSKHILDLLRNWLVLSSKGEGINLTSGSGQENHNQTTGPKDEGSKQSSFFSWCKGERNKTEQRKQSATIWQRFPSATNLKEAGVKLRNVTPDSILDVNFKDGTLEIPSFVIHESTEDIFRNLISLEQCTPKYPPTITSYVILMDNLINTTKDMEILSKNKIINNWMDPEDATQSFNNLYDDAFIYSDKFHYLALCIEVNKYCEQSWPKWRANLMHNYFSSPWAIVGVLVGGTAWILTLLQTIFTL